MNDSFNLDLDKMHYKREEDVQRFAEAKGIADLDEAAEKLKIAMRSRSNYLKLHGKVEKPEKVEKEAKKVDKKDEEPKEEKFKLDLDSLSIHRKNDVQLYALLRGITDLVVAKEKLNTAKQDRKAYLARREARLASRRLYYKKTGK